MADAESKIIVTVDSSGAVTGLKAAGVAVEDFAEKTQRGTTVVRTLALSVRDLRGAMMGLQGLFGGLAIDELAHELIKVNSEFEQVRLALYAGSKTALAAGADFAFLREEAERLGLPVSKIGIEFARLTAAAKGTALQGQPVRDVFSSVSEALVATGRNSQSAQRTFLAISEMLSTVTATAREARIQFGQQLPGGFRIMAEAWAKATGQMFDTNTVNKFMEALRKGGVDAVGILRELPAILRNQFGSAFDAASASSPVVAMGRFQVAIQNMIYAMGQSGFMREFIGMLNDIATILSGNKMGSEIEKLADNLGDLMRTVRVVVDFVVGHLRLFAGAFTGYVAGVAVLALKAFTGWLLKVAEVGAVADLIASPWLLVAGAIALVVGLVVAFGSSIITIGGHAAHVTDVFVTFFTTIGELFVKAYQGSQGLRDLLIIITQSVLDVADVVWSILITAFKAFWEIGKIVLNDVKELLGALFHNVTGKDWAGGIILTFQTLIQVTEAFVTGVAAGFNFIAQVILITLGTLQPFIDGVANLLSAIGDAFAIIATAIAGVPISPLQAMAGILHAVWELIGLIIATTVSWINILAEVGGAIASALGSVIRGIADVIAGLISGLGLTLHGFHGRVTVDSKAATAAMGHNWVEVGDVVLGFIVSAIKEFGLLIEIIGVVGNVILQLLGRIVAFGQGGFAILHGASVMNAQEIKNGVDILRDVFTKPLDPTGNSRLQQDLNNIGIEADMHIVSRALAAGAKVKDAYDHLGSQTVNGLNTLHTTAFQTAAMNAANDAAAAGKGTAGAYVQGMIDEWGRNAAAATAAGDAATRQLNASRDALGAAQRAAWDAENADVDRTARANLDKPGKHPHHAVTPQERAAIAATNFTNQFATDKQALDLLSAQGVSWEHINGLLAAQNALKSTGLRMTVAQAEAQGGVAAHLVHAAIAATEMADQVKKASEAVQQIAKNNAAASAAREDLALIRDRTMSTQQLSEAMAEQKAIRDRELRDRHGNLITTLEQAQASAFLGDANALTAVQTAYSARELEHWTITLAAAQKTAQGLDAFEQQRHELELYTQAAQQGQQAIANVTAELEAQHQVMALFGDRAFRADRLDDQNTRQFYDEARAMAQLGTSAAEFMKTLRQIHEEAVALDDPLLAERDRIQEQNRLLEQQLQAWLNISMKSARINLNSSLLSGDNAGVRAALAQMKSATEQFNAASNDLRKTTDHQLALSSSNIMTVVKAHFHDQLTAAQQFSVQIGQTFDKAVDGMSQALADFVTTGKADFSSLALSIINDISKMIIKWMILTAIKAVGHLLGFEDGGVMSKDGSVGLSQAKNFALGGVMTGAGLVPLHRYAGGGVTSTPQMALFGEGSMPEAYVPLPDGRTIPVTVRGGATGSESVARSVQLGLMSGFSILADKMSHSGKLTRQVTPGGGAGGQHIELHSHVTVQNHGGGGQGGMDEKDADTLIKRIHGELKDLIITTVLDQSRPGGTFNPLGGIPGSNISSRGG